MLDLPESWTHDELQSVALVVTGGTPPTSDDSLYGHDHLFVSPSDLGSWKWVDRSEKMISEKGWRRVRRVPHRASLFVCIGSTIGKVGMAASDLCTNQQINAAIPNQKVCPDFLYYALCASAEAVKEQAGEQAVPIVNKSEFSKLKLRLPPLPEQNAIAEALNDADGVIAGLERLIAKKRQIKQGAMQDLLTARRRLPGFSGEWEDFQLSNHGKFLGGSGFPIVHQGETSGQYPFFKVSDFSGVHNANQLTQANHYISEETRRKISARIFPSQAIAFAKIGAGIFLERKRMIAQDSCLDNNMAAYVLDDPALSIDLILAKFHEFSLGSLVSSTALPAISSSDLKAIVFRLPSQLEEQSAIATVLSDMDAEIQALDARLTKARAVKEGMMQVLLTGRVRLV